MRRPKPRVLAWRDDEYLYGTEQHVGGFMAMAGVFALPVCIAYAASPWWGGVAACVEGIVIGVSMFHGAVVLDADDA